MARRARQIVRREKRQRKARKPRQGSIEGPTLPEHCWTSKEHMEALAVEMVQHEDRCKAKLMLIHWPPSGGDVWYDPKRCTAQWRDTLDGEPAALVIPRKLGTLWTRRPTKIGLPPPELTAEGYRTEKLYPKRTMLTLSQCRRLEAECKALGIDESEAIRLALMKFGFLAEFEYKI